MQKEKLKYTFEVYKKLATYVNFPAINLPVLIEKDIHDITEEDIIQKALNLEVFRELIRFLLKNLISTAEKNGIVIAEANMSDGALDAVIAEIVIPRISLTSQTQSRFLHKEETEFSVLHCFQSIQVRSTNSQTNCGVPKLFLYSD